MPNKEKSLKNVPKPNGKVDSVIKSAAESNAVHSTSDKKRNNKNKNKVAKNNNNSSSTSTNQIVENHSTSDAIDSDEIQAVGEELLKRLQLNGTSVTRCPPTTTNGQTENVIANDTQPKQINNGANDVANDKSKSQQIQLNHSNNNNNNSKVHNKNSKNNNRSKQTTSVNSSNDSAEIEQSNEPTNVQCNGSHSTDDGMGTAETDAESKTSSSECTDSAKPTTSAGPSEPMHSNPNLEMPSTSKEPNQSNLSTTTRKHCPIHHKCIDKPRTALSVKSIKTDTIEVTFKEYESELQMPDIMRVIQRELSEPYSIYTYRYFIHNWPKLCFLAMDGDSCIGAIVCKLDIHRQMTKRGYIAMLAVDAAYRKLKVGTTLVQKAIEVSYWFSFRFKSTKFLNFSFQKKNVVLFFLLCYCVGNVGAQRR